VEEEIAEDLPNGIQEDQQCIEQFAANVEKTAKYPLNRQEINQFFVMTVSGASGMLNRENSVEKILEDSIPAIKECMR